MAAERLLIPWLAALLAASATQRGGHAGRQEGGRRRRHWWGGQDSAQGAGHRTAERQPGGPLRTCWELLSAAPGGTCMHAG